MVDGFGERSWSWSTGGRRVTNVVFGTVQEESPDLSSVPRVGGVVFRFGVSVRKGSNIQSHCV